ncbi:MAG: hypothetical protein JWM68_4371 [Verrucomicrobiales bacterium]|nr:hypothetical protein [Verrucomicrobiales bacterium]
MNLTHSEPRDRFVTRYSGVGTPPDFWPSVLAEFDADALRTWAAEFGVETFVGTSGRVFPKELKAAPLLRRWVERLRKQGVEFQMRHRWTGLTRGTRWNVHFTVEGEPHTFEADAVILALGGGSWPDTGSDGGWTDILRTLGVTIAPLMPANCGWEVSWPAALLPEAEGKSVKNITARVSSTVAVGELLITRYGLEGGIVYQLGSALRAMADPEISIDFKPSFTAEQLISKLGGARRHFLAEAQSKWRLSEAAFAMLKHLSNEEAVGSAAALAATVKNFRVRLTGPRPLAEAISSAGGVCWSELESTLMLRKFPGVFVAGEMIDWEAPTGGYLMQGCFATGTRAARSALKLEIASPD